jgi:hypothetical protein
LKSDHQIPVVVPSAQVHVVGGGHDYLDTAETRSLHEDVSLWIRRKNQSKEKKSWQQQRRPPRPPFRPFTRDRAMQTSFPPFVWMTSGLAASTSLLTAYTTRASDISTKDLAQYLQSGGHFFGIHVSNHGRVMVFAGGIPLIRGRESARRRGSERRFWRAESRRSGSWSQNILNC